MDSIIYQLTDDCELLIIDGGSTDSTNRIIASYGNKISYTVSEVDKGIYDAWNKGVKVANGKWIAFVGADDVLLPNALDSYLNVINNTDCIDSYDYICAHNEYVGNDGRLLKLLGEEPTWNVLRKGMVAAHVASLHNKKNLFDTVGEYNLSFKICADYELLLRKKNRIKYIFIDAHIAQMKVGGMSFSLRAIKECYLIRKSHETVSELANVFLFVRDCFAYEFFKIRKSLQGGNII